MKHATVIREIKTRSVKHLNLDQINDCLKGLGQVVRESIRGDGEVKILGLGKFKTRKVKQSLRRNPKTGELVTVPARFKLLFFPTSDLAAFCKEAAKSE